MQNLPFSSAVYVIQFSFIVVFLFYSLIFIAIRALFYDFMCVYFTVPFMFLCCFLHHKWWRWLTSTTYSSSQSFHFPPSSSRTVCTHDCFISVDHEQTSIIVALVKRHSKSHITCVMQRPCRLDVAFKLYTLVYCLYFLTAVVDGADVNTLRYRHGVTLILPCSDLLIYVCQCYQMFKISGTEVVQKVPKLIWWWSQKWHQDH